MRNPQLDHELEAAIPPDIRDDLREARLCWRTGAHTACFEMARRALWRILAEQGCPQSDVGGQLTHAVEQGVLRGLLHASAEKIRDLTTRGGGEPPVVSKAEAERLYEFVRLITYEFYEFPAQVQRLQDRLARRPGQEPLPPASHPMLTEEDEVVELAEPENVDDLNLADDMWDDEMSLQPGDGDPPRRVAPEDPGSDFHWR